MPKSSKISHQKGYDDKVKKWEETRKQKYPTPEDKEAAREAIRQANLKAALKAAK